MLRRIAVRGHNNRQPLAQEVVGNLVDLAIAARRQTATLADGDDGGVERVVDAGLEGRIEKGELPDLGR